MSSLTTYCGDPHASPNRGWCDAIHNGSPHYGSYTLDQHVEARFSKTELPSHHHGCCLLGSCTTNAAEALNHGGKTQSKAQRD